MPTKPIERLLFAQGGLCFFCKKKLASSDASVEHLVASANGGGNRDDNCVACCKALNALLGSMSLKEKIQVFINQKGEFKCPNGLQKKIAKSKTKPAATVPDRYSQVVDNLEHRGKSRPLTIPKLKSTISALFKKEIATVDVDAFVIRLQNEGVISVAGAKVVYLKWKI